MLKALNISKSIHSKTILSNCSLSIKPGRFVAVVGPNGAGKTTLLKILAAEMKQFEGTVMINGQPLKSYKTRELSKVRAVLPQHSVINFPFTVEQVIEIGRYPYRTGLRHNKKVIEEAMIKTNLLDYRNRIYQTLSGGEKQRVQMARVIAQTKDKSPFVKYLLLDEPTSSLDLAQQHIIMSLAKEFCDHQMGVLAVLHDLNLALQYADEILFLKNGRTIAYGPLKEVITQKIIGSTFNHPVNIIDYDNQRVVVPKIPIQKHVEPFNSVKYG